MGQNDKILLFPRLLFDQECLTKLFFVCFFSASAIDCSWGLIDSTLLQVHQKNTDLGITFIYEAP